jgi:type IV pilus assembly protein PilM
MARGTAIGLDIGTSGVRAAELSFGKGGITLEKFGQVAVPEGAIRDGEVIDGDVVSAAIRQLWSQTGFTHKNVIMGVANQRVIVRTVDLPWMPIAELRASLALQVQDFIPMPVDAAVLDFHPLEELVDGSGSRQLRGLLVAAARDMVMSNVRAVEAAGLRAVMVDLTSFAVLRSMGKAGVADSELEALVDIGAKVTNIVVHSGGVPRFVRILLMGGQDVTDAVADQLGLPQTQAEALKQELGATEGHDEVRLSAGRAVESMSAAFVDEIRGSLDYFAASNPSGPVQGVVVSGGGSRLRGLADRLASATRLPVHVGNPMLGLHLGRTGLTDEQITFVQPLAAVPVGLALGAAS